MIARTAGNRNVFSKNKLACQPTKVGGHRHPWTQKSHHCITVPLVEIEQLREDQWFDKRGTWVLNEEVANRLKTPDGPETSAAATASVKTKAAKHASAPLTISPPNLLVEVEPMDKIAALGKETDAGVLQLYRPSGICRAGEPEEEIGRPSLSGSGGPRPSDLSGNSAVRVPGSTPVGVHPINRVASAMSNLAVGRRASSKVSKTSVERYVVELEREKARRAAELEAAEKRFNKINQENLDRYSKTEEKIERLLAEVASTKEMLGQMRVPEALAEIRKVVARPAPRIMNYAEAAAKPKTAAAAANPWPLFKTWYRTHPHRGFGENHPRSTLLPKLRGVVDARDGSPSQKCGSTVIIRDVLRVNSDEDIVRSLRTQNRHLSEGLGGKRSGPGYATGDGRNDLECHPVLEVSPELYHRLISRLCIRGSSKGAGMGPVPGAALTEWRDGRGDVGDTEVKNGKDGLVNIFSDSRSSLEVLAGPKTYHPLAHEASATSPRSLWKAGLLERMPESRETSARTSSPGAPPSPSRQRTMTGFRCRTRKEMTSHLAQTLTGHGGFSQYLHRFKLKDSPYCACDPAKIQDVLHVLEECQCFCGSVWH
ncbi:hypothetical protein EVAR_72846_1 [Eumeta japonica]|uniref:Uncharacterized protein n=1 Tax=Eumeta variegata TaxID=151549 RepID=A0A4C1SHV3_EUMVA|nr:hypothetical protein EVAR_72846_1 [Eumeta japonica]